MAKTLKPIDYEAPVIRAMEILMALPPDKLTSDIVNANRVIIHAYFKEKGANVPFPILNIAKKLMDITLREAEKEEGYRSLFEQFADQPFQLIKILIRRDPDRFFDFFLIAWNLPGILGKYLQDDTKKEKDGRDVEREEDAERGPGDDAKSPSRPDDEDENGHVAMPTGVIERIRQNIKFLDEDDIFELLIPVFKQLSVKEGGEVKDGFQRGYEMILRLTDGIDDEEILAKITRVFERFDKLIEMKFGRFHSSIKRSRKNFPYITVRAAIMEMAKMEKGAGGARRFAHFATRTAKTSLALLEPEYLGKNRSLYICPPDTIPTILREYEAYGGDESQLKVVRNAKDLSELIGENGNIRYCVISSELLIQRDKNVSEKEKVPAVDVGDEGANLEEIVESIEENPDDNGNESDGGEICDAEGLRGVVNPLVLELFEKWKPDYVAVDESRHFTGYRCEPNQLSSKRSRALLYLLNNKDSLERKITVRLLDATPGDLPRHFYPLISILHPDKYPTPEKVREDVGTKPYALMSLFGDKADHATQVQVYNPPTVKSEAVSASMGPAQSVIYGFAAKYSVKNVLHRTTLARIATFSPAVLRPLFGKIVKKMQKATFLKHFDAVYDEWQERSKGSENVPFDWDFIAQFGDRKFLIDLFTFSPELREDYLRDQPEKLTALKGLYVESEALSCKAQYAIRKLKEIVSLAKNGEKHPKRIIIFCSFKRGLTRDIDDDLSDRWNIERMLSEQIKRAVPEVSVYSIDGNISSIPRKDGYSSRDNVREDWKTGGEENSINVLIAVGPSTCQGVDLAVKGQQILEIYLDESMDSRMEEQVHSRTGGPDQNRMVLRLQVHAVTEKGGATIDEGVSQLIAAKTLFRELVCRAAVPVSPEFLKAIEDGDPFLGVHCKPEGSGEEIADGTRGKVKKIVK